MDKSEEKFIKPVVSQATKQQILNQMPQNVIKNGKVIPVRSEVDKMVLLLVQLHFVDWRKYNSSNN